MDTFVHPELLPVIVVHCGESEWCVVLYFCIIKSAKCTYLSKLSDLNGSFVWVMVMCPTVSPTVLVPKVFLYNKNYVCLDQASPAMASPGRQTNGDNFPKLFSLMAAHHGEI